MSHPAEGDVIEKARGVILTHQVRTIDWQARGAVVIDRVPRAALLAVRARLKALLGLWGTIVQHIGQCHG